MAIYLGYDRVGIVKYIKVPVRANVITLTGIYTFTLSNVVGKEVDELEIKGNSIQERNIFNKETMGERIYAYIEGSTIWAYAGDSYSVRIPVKPNTTYTISTENDIDIFRVACLEVEDIPSLDVRNVPIVNTVRQTDNTPITITTTENTLYLVIQANATSMTTTLETLKVEQSQPTPEAPIEIQSVGDKTSNLQPNSFHQVSSQYVTQEEDGWINIDCDNTNGTSTAYVNFWADKNEDLINGETYTFVFETQEVQNISSILLSQERDSGELPQFNTTIEVSNITSNSIQFLTAVCNNATEGKYLNRAFFSLGIGVHRKIKLRLSLLKGTVTQLNYTGYEPYGYKVPVKLGGKNLFNDTLSDGYISSTGADVYSVKNVKNTNIIGISQNATLSFDTDVTIGKISFCYYENGVFTRRVETYSSEHKLTTSLQGNENGIRFYITSVDDMVSSDVTNVQLEIGAIATKYEPYSEPITKNIFLSEPLRKIGDYADYIDYKNKKVKRLIKHLELNGTERWRKSSVTENRFMITVTESYMGNYSYSDDILLCDRLVANRIRDVGTIDVSYTLSQAYGVELVFGLVFSTLDEVVQYVKDQYNAGTPMIVDYVLYEPTEETIDIPFIKLKDGTNIVTIDTKVEPSETKITYWEEIIDG